MMMTSQCQKALLPVKNKVCVFLTSDSSRLTETQSFSHPNSYSPLQYHPIQCPRYFRLHPQDSSRLHLSPTSSLPRLRDSQASPHHLRGLLPHNIPPQDSPLYHPDSLSLQHHTVACPFLCPLPRLDSSPGNGRDLDKILFQTYHTGRCRGTHHYHRSQELRRVIRFHHPRLYLPNLSFAI